ncbi:MAG TPA: hypothetical protein VF454_01215 [Gemmatimonadales bacterium]
MTRPLRRSLLVLCLLAPPLQAQSDPVEIEARAGDARDWWRDAGEALRAGDSLLALARLDSAATSWPGQSAYHRAVARFAARLGRVDRAFLALEALTTMGVAWAEDDPTLAALRTDPRFVAAAARNRTATAPLTRSTVAWGVQGAEILAEGLAIDSATGRSFISSVRPGRVLVRERDGQVHDFFPPGARGARAILGMTIDRRRGLLWVTSADTMPGGEEYPEFSHESALYAFDLATGAFRATVELPIMGRDPAAEGHQLGDVIITPQGTLYASDTWAGVVFRVPPGALPKVAEIVAQGSPAFRNLQGMVVTSDERVMYLADYSHGLLRVDLATGEVTGIPAPAGQTLLGIDGMANGGPGRLLAVQNGITPVRVIAIHLDRAGWGVERIEVLDRPDLAPGEATLAVRNGRERAYVATRPGAIRTLRVDP